MSDTDFVDFFKRATTNNPHSWQRNIGMDSECRHRFLRIPTGFGKTAGTVLAWLFHRVERDDRAWPTRLVFCLPMRVLVEQTEGEIHKWLTALGLRETVGVHVLLGGRTDRDWVLNPEKPAILIGTQDMLLSRALNRGYSASRRMWPVDFGLLGTDTLWVLDEVQLMDVALATSAQLSAFREADRSLPGRQLARPSVCWWMSATMQPSWLEKAIDFAHSEPLAALKASVDEIEASQRTGGLWDVRKHLERRQDLLATDPKKLAQAIREKHEPGTLSLVVVNTVKKALAVFDALQSLQSKDLPKAKGRRQAKDASSEPVRDEQVELHLLHSRFRGAERRALAAMLASKISPEGPGRIVVATQVVEAGVDISAKVLWTELAPWPSLVQRFGRAARYPGETAQVFVVGAVPKSDKDAAPYRANECAAANEALTRLIETQSADCSPKSLEAFEASLDASERAKLYPYEPLHVLRRRDLDGLFDTTPDLSGSDLDISRYLRSGDERDVRVFWRDLQNLPSAPNSKEAPKSIPKEDIGGVERDELCPVPIGELKEWMKSHSVWRLDFDERTWEQVRPDRIVPGMTLLCDAKAGGYDRERGWNAGSTTEIERPPIEKRDAALQTPSTTWQTISEHDGAVEKDLVEMTQALGMSDSLTHVLALAARFHDWGKSHEAFQRRIRRDAREESGKLDAKDIAKAPNQAWETNRKPKPQDRPGLRHELASTMALFALLRRAAPDHAALTAPLKELFDVLGTKPEPVEESDRIPNMPGGLIDELKDLSADEFNLLAYLVCAHHGCVRCTWSSTADDQDSGRDRLRGIEEGDTLPEIALAGTTLPSVRLDLCLAAMGANERYGASWGERTSALLEAHGPFGLAFLEALLRAADMRVSKRDAPENLD